MGTKLHSSLTLTLCMVSFLAGHGEGQTIGQVSSAFFGCTYGQVKRMLTNLENDELVYKEMMPHGGTGKYVYRVTEKAAIIACDIATSYSQHYNGGL